MGGILEGVPSRGVTLSYYALVRRAARHLESRNACARALSMGTRAQDRPRFIPLAIRWLHRSEQCAEVFHLFFFLFH